MSHAFRPLLVIAFAAAWISTRAAQAQTALQADRSSPEVVYPVETESHEPCPEDDCPEGERRPFFRLGDWIRKRPVRSLFGHLSAAKEPVPWASWNEHPVSIGCFIGPVQGGPLMEDWVGTTVGFDGGWRLGWDFHPNFGVEMRFAFGTLDLYDSYRAHLSRWSADTLAGMDPLDPLRGRYDHRNADMFQWDVDVLYYPCGESRVRPYFLTGMGLTDVRFSDRMGLTYHVTSLALPVGLGVKYLCNERLDVRLDVLDDIAFSSQSLCTQHNVSLTAGVEVRLGGSRKVYWPWSQGRYYW